MDTIAKQKALTDRVYGLLEDFDPLLAGGAPRDWHAGQAARDLDFYIQTEDYLTSATGVADLLGIELRPLGEGEYDELLANEISLLAVYEGEFYGQKVQFMFLNVNPLSFIKEKFDLSICKVWYTGGEVKMDWEARLSFRENILVMKDGFNRHAEKLMSRDPWGSQFAFLGSWERALGFMENRGEPHLVFDEDLDVGLFDDDDDEPVVGPAVNLQNDVQEIPREPF